MAKTKKDAATTDSGNTSTGDTKEVIQRLLSAESDEARLALLRDHIHGIGPAHLGQNMHVDE